MRRERVNFIRYLLEEWIPPALRDSAPMRWLFRAYWGRFVDDLEQFRSSIHRVTPAEYADIYRRMPRIQEGTDNSGACIRRLVELMLPGSVCDVGCGTGHLLAVLAANSKSDPRKFTGVDFQLESGISQRYPAIEFREADVERLPFPDRAFDTHVHFFPYPHSFLRHISPVPSSARCEVIGRDLLYIEDVVEGS